MDALPLATPNLVNIRSWCEILEWLPFVFLLAPFDWSMRRQVWLIASCLVDFVIICVLAVYLMRHVVIINVSSAGVGFLCQLAIHCALVVLISRETISLPMGHFSLFLR